MKVGEKTNTIYALVHERTVYVGKTKGDLGAVYYRHRRAENPYTAGYYYPKNSKNPSIHILKERALDTPDTDRFITAWMYIFQRVGYSVINTEYVPEDPDELQPDIKSLVSVLCPFSMDVFLKATQYVKETREGKREKPSERKQRKEKVTVWVAHEEKVRFLEYAKSMSFTQSEAMQYLISKAKQEKENPFMPNWFDDGFTRNREEMYTRKFEKQENEIHQLKSTIHCLSEEKKQESTKLKQCQDAAQKALVDYYSYFESTAVVPLDVERGRYRDYVRSLPGDIVYDYPIGFGSTLIQLQAYLYGEGAVRFVLGVDQQGNYRKFRYYPNQYFYGISPGNERFSHRLSVWYVEWRQSGEVADLVAAFPMQIRPVYRNPMDEREKLDRWVDQVLEETEKHKD